MLIDVSMPITPGAVFRRGSPPVDIVTRKFRNESEGEYETVVLTMPAHTATHIDLVFGERRISPERMIGQGKLFDVTGTGSGRIQLNDIEGKAGIDRGDFVFFRTDWDEVKPCGWLYQARLAGSGPLPTVAEPEYWKSA